MLLFCNEEREQVLFLKPGVEGELENLGEVLEQEFA